MSIFTEEECEKYRKDPTRNPKNNKKLQKGKTTDKSLEKQCLKKTKSTKVASTKVASTKILQPETSELSLEDYTDKSFVIRGDTKIWKENLKELGARFNPRLKGGAGWVISKKHQDEITNFVKQVNKGKIKPIAETPKSSKVAKITSISKTSKSSSSDTPESDLSIEEYTDKSFVIRGDTKLWKENLKELGARFNPRLKGGPGWVISKKRQDEINEFIKKANKGKITPLKETSKPSSTKVASTKVASTKVASTKVTKKTPKITSNKSSTSTTSIGRNSNPEELKNYIMDVISHITNDDKKTILKFIKNDLRDIINRELINSIKEGDLDRVITLINLGAGNIDDAAIEAFDNEEILKYILKNGKFRDIENVKNKADKNKNLLKFINKYYQKNLYI